MRSKTSAHFFFIACVAASGVASSSLGDTVISNYVGPVSGNWSLASNWTPTGSPSNGGGTAYSVIVNTNRQASTVWVDNNPAISFLTIGSDDMVAIPNANFLTLLDSPVANNGVLAMNSGGNGTDLRIGAPVVTFTGTGSLSMGNNPWNLVRNNFGEIPRVVNDTQHTIRGAGQFGYNSIALTNHGTIRANLSNQLSIDLADGGNHSNDGLMEATDGGTLRITYSGYINGTGGTIRAKDASAVYLESTHLFGGFLATEGSGVISTVSGGVPLLENLTNTGMLVIRNNEYLALNEIITNNGTISMQSGGNGTDLRLNTAQVVLTGTGSLSMSDNQWNLVRNNFGEIPRLINANSHTIKGSGQLGYNSIAFTNYGLVDANQATPIYVDLADGFAHVNQGQMRASNGGTLRIQYSGAIDNSIGVIRALAGSTVQFEGTRINGGILDSVGTGYLSTVSGAAPYFDGVHLTGVFHHWNNHPLALMNTFINDGTYYMDSGGNGTDLRINTSVVSLTGSGQIVMSNNPWNVIRNDFGEVTRVVNESSHTIRGAGQLGYNSVVLTNHGTIRADQSNALTLDLSEAQGSFNDGIIEAASGGTLNFWYAGSVNNAGGIIRAMHGSVVGIEGTWVQGGELASEGSGYLGTVSGGAPQLDGVHLTGAFHHRNSHPVNLMNTLVNDGTYFMDSGGNGTDLRIQTPQVVLTGSGQMVLSNNPWNIIRNAFGEVTTLINDTTHTIRGGGQVGYNSIRVENRGTMISDASSGLWVDPADAQGFLNTGLFHTLNGSAGTAYWGGFEQAGTVDIDAGSSFARYGDYVQTAGNTIVNGTLQMNSGSVQMLGGTLEGTGTVNGVVVNTSGTVAPGNSPGTLSVNGGYQQGAAGTLAIELGGFNPAQCDFLAVTGNAQLNGVLRVNLINGFAPQAGAQFTVLQTSGGGTITGQFTSIEPCNFIATYFPTYVLLTAGTTVPADFNCDGQVDGADLGILLGSWGPCASCATDLNGDGQVDGADLGMLLGAWTT